MGITDYSKHISILVITLCTITNWNYTYNVSGQIKIFLVVLSVVIVWLISPILNDRQRMITRDTIYLEAVARASHCRQVYNMLAGIFRYLEYGVIGS